MSINEPLRIGAVMRVYNKPDGDGKVDPKALISSVDRAAANVRQLLDWADENDESSRFFDHAMVLVPTEYDCGLTTRLLNIPDGLENWEDSQKSPRASVLATPGHHSCAALNAAVEDLVKKGMTHAAFISGKVVPGLVNPDTVGHIVHVFENMDAKVVGIRVPGLSELGIIPINNTFCVWEIAALLDVGGFASELEVEEVGPISGIIEAHGNVVFLVDSLPTKPLQIINPDRHDQVKREKMARQQQEADRLGISLPQLAQRIIRI